MRLKEITGVTPLLSKDGTLLIEGWAKHPYFTVPSRRPSHTMWKGSCLIFSRQNGYIITISICLQAISCTAAVSFTDLKQKQSVSIKAKQHSSAAEGSLSDSALSDYFITFQDKASTLTLTFIHRGKSCFIIFNAPSLVLPDGTKGLLGDFVLTHDVSLASINTAVTADDDRKAFTVSGKIPFVIFSDGVIRRGQIKDSLSQVETDVMLDWSISRHSRGSDSLWALMKKDDELLSYENGLLFHYSDGDITGVEEADFSTGRLSAKDSILTFSPSVSDGQWTYGSFSDGRRTCPGFLRTLRP